MWDYRPLMFVTSHPIVTQLPSDTNLAEVVSTQDNSLSLSTEARLLCKVSSLQ